MKFTQVPFTHLHERVRCPKDAPRGARCLREHRRGLAEIVELVGRSAFYRCPRVTPSTRSPQANVGFLGGLFGFVGLLGIRAYLAFGPAFGRFGALLCGAVVTHGCSVVNAGIAAGDGSGARHASNYLGLVARYVTLVVANAWRTRGPLRIISLLCVVGAAWTASAAARTEHGDDCPLAK